MASSRSKTVNYDKARCVVRAREFMGEAWAHRSFESLMWAVESLVKAAEADVAAKKTQPGSKK